MLRELQPQSESVRESWNLEEVFETRHKTAAEAVRFEEWLANHTERALRNQDEFPGPIFRAVETEIRARFGDLPETTLREYIYLAHGYVGEVRRAKELENTFTDVAARSHTALGLHTKEREQEPAYGTLLGRYLFVERTGHEPEGEVQCERREGYLVMVCATEKDYKDMLQDSGIPALEKSAGTFHEKMLVGRSAVELKSVIVIRGVTGEDYQETFTRVARHERQHFINRVGLEKFSGLLRLREKQEQGGFEIDLKDELLAYIRDGSSGDDLQQSLSSDLYNHLFGRLPDDKREGARTLVTSVAHALGELEQMFNTPEARALLTYHLVDVPLTQIPSVLKRLRTFYEKRGRVWEENQERETRAKAA